jgi:hypothetical protein
MNMKNNFARLASQLLQEGKKDSAIAVLDRCEKVMPNNRVPYNYFNIFLADVYYKAGLPEKANKMLEILASRTADNLKYLLSMPPKFSKSAGDESQHHMAVAQEILRTLDNNNQKATLEKIGKMFESVMAIK